MSGHRLAAAVLLLAASSAAARQEFLTTVPNAGVYRCTTCHLASSGGEGWNELGKDVLEAGGANPDANPDDQNEGYTGSPTWSEVCELDSDGDGYGNGEELGDPECAWSEGDTDPPGPVSNPGDALDSPGDGGLCAASGAASGALPVLALLAVLGATPRRRLRSRSR